ncbi:hypothetical protein SteCoe_38888 [Stentor coeruleus]|uniref:Uncharacterized protein n=1 Tax=Stentor coeruleus TaxID=5963 RepID=A0A1R2AL13_9CILI|nr:hypothetical protein SteCoe_38888 [Stentor coeruleus]
MSYCEGFLMKKKNRKEIKNTLEKIIENQYICQMNFKENNCSDTSNINRNFAVPDLTSSVENLRLTIPTRNALTSSYKKNNWVSS